MWQTDSPKGSQPLPTLPGGKGKNQTTVCLRMQNKNEGH